jgi:serine/threonine-protein kinase
MGEVYRARDTKLGRDVAIKVVSDSFSHDPERRARFEREAHLLATLNHPHIATIHGLEETNGTQFLVMELVDGETLAGRLEAGPLPVSEALSVARQIADALQAAHEKGIIHRDLKPANIAFTPDGQVKVLDFGLAKEVDALSEPDLANSPTMTLGATTAGVILGTAAYMAPEQAKGKAADKRSDVWAFGCVLYEMLTGKRAFEGESVSETLATVLRGEPNWADLPGALPPTIRTLLQRCLLKDRARRIAEISTAHFLLSECGSLAAQLTSTTQPILPWRRVIITASVALGAAAAAGSGVWFATRQTPRVLRLLIAPSSETALDIGIGAVNDIAITPDGRTVVYVGGKGTLFARPLDQLDATPLTDATGADRPVGPFVSPRGDWVAFSTGAPQTLKKVAMTGGPSVSLVRLDGGFSGGTWGPSGSIVFGTNNPATGLQQVEEGGGEPVVLTRPDRALGETDHVLPEFLPDGQTILFTIRTSTSTSGDRDIDQAQIAVFDLRTRTYTTLIRGGSNARYVPSGHLVYGAAGTLRAVRFDLAQLAVVGTPVPVVPQVVMKVTGAVDVAVAREGTVVYVPSRVAEVLQLGPVGQRKLVWIDRAGGEEPINAPARGYVYPRLSPDEQRVALDIRDQESDIWTFDFVRGTLIRLTFASDRSPVWTHDGQRVLFASARDGRGNLSSQAADGTGAIERLTESLNNQLPSAVSPDGSRAVFNEEAASSGDIMIVTLDKERRIEPVVQTSFLERNGEISRDGRWLAYESNESGRFEIYVRPFPDTSSGRWLVSNGGGSRPLWARSGRELYYVSSDGALMAVPFEAGSSWKHGTAIKLLGNSYAWSIGGNFFGRSYDVSATGRFLVTKLVVESGTTAAPSNLVVVQHFDQELKRLVPTD